MDREAAVIRAEMNQTRAQLDRKIGLLEERARAYSPRQLSDRYLPDFLAEKVLGSLLTLAPAATLIVTDRYRASSSPRPLG